MKIVHAFFLYYSFFFKFPASAHRLTSDPAGPRMLCLENDNGVLDVLDKSFYRQNKSVCVLFFASYSSNCPLKLITSKKKKNLRHFTCQREISPRNLKKLQPFCRITVAILLRGEFWTSRGPISERGYWLGVFRCHCSWRQWELWWGHPPVSFNSLGLSWCVAPRGNDFRSKLLSSPVSLCLNPTSGSPSPI